MESLFAEVGDRRQETGDRRQETNHPSPLPLPGGEVRRNGNERGGRSKNCQNDFSAQLLPKILAF
ncbi:hypothetical protein [Okeania hirsuta]|uniref:hypothetical protein n=1 Tax=Okeania hirsuta TaxID=1458930 RepID=UPI000F532040|nr:hypothetical protein [Okeania hirsuta]RQH18251.1 hypothetical protein D4Z78_15760 [Okeania hirsuta]